MSGRFRPTILLALVASLASADRSAASDRYAMRKAVSRRATAARRVRGADADEQLDLTITLQLRDPAGLAALLAAQQDPGSPQYHRWLTPAQFTDRFAPAPDVYAAVVAWLQSEGFAVHPKVNGSRIDFTGPVRRIEPCFGVHMSHYAYRGRTPLANDDPPLLPTAFRDAIAFVRLNSFPLAEPLVPLSNGRQIIDAMAPQDLAVAYDVEPLRGAGIDGAGQTIAVVARSDFDAGDVTDFQQQFGVPVHAPVKVFPTTNPGIGAANGVCRGIRNSRQLADCLTGEQGEVSLDTEWAGALAPSATILVDISGGDVDVSLMDVVTHHSSAKIITMSFGTCERLDTSGLMLFAPLYAQAAAQGQTVLVSTGDDGADSCQDGKGPSINALASDANVTAVGGTTLDPGFDASGNAAGYVGETAWNDADGASGGGASVLVSKPAYQSAPGVPADGARDQPDVALLAAPSGPGYVIVVNGGINLIGGTSAAAPSWAGIVALLNQTRPGGSLGALNPLLYGLGRRQYAEGGARVFHDVTQGDNTFNGVSGYAANAGYDLVTGLGSPDVAELAAALDLPPEPTPTATPRPTATPIPRPTATNTARPTPSATAKATPTRGTPAPTPTRGPCVGDCNGDGLITVDELVKLVAFSLGTANDCSTCLRDVPAGTPCDSVVTISVVIRAENDALRGCGP